MGNEEKIKELEDLIANSQYNKRTQKAIGQYKAQLAKLKERASTSGSGKGAPEGYNVRKTGDGTVALLGFPSVGKSTLLNSLTDAESEVASYAFTTLTVIPGVLDYKFAKIQILDIPGIVHGAASGKGRGSEVLGVLRSADLILMVIDVQKPEHHKALLKEIYESGIRINKKVPDVKITKTAKDGIRIGRTVSTPDLDNETIETVLRTFRINNADVLIRSKITVDEFIDCIEANKVFIPAVTVLNKVDLVSKERALEVSKLVNADIMISADKSQNLEALKDLIFEKLDLIRLYMKEPGKEADLKEPMIIKKDSTVEDVCNKLHRDFVKKFKNSRIWGKSAKFPGQRQSLKHILLDEDIIELHIR